MTFGTAPSSQVSPRPAPSSARAHKQLLDDERDERRRTFRRPQRTVNTTRANQTGLGSRHLGVGISLSSGFVALFLLWRFAIQWDQYVNPLPTLAAWIILFAATVTTLVLVNRLAGRMPTWMFLTVLATGEIIVGLDLAGYGRGGNLVTYPTAAAAVGALFTILVTVRRGREIVAATLVLGAVIAAGSLTNARSDPFILAPAILTITLCMFPPLVGVSIVRGFRRMVQRELDLVLVQSTVTQPSSAVGMLASEELARIDLDAETLLDDVATGRTALPLSAAKAAAASTLATQLRLHLIEGRRETWLHHALTESEFLGPAVNLDDPAGLAGQLSPEQRDALLLAIWLLISDTEGAEPTVSLVLGPLGRISGQTIGDKLRFPIKMIIEGVPRRRVDPETWQAIRVVGPHIDSVRSGQLHVDIECSIDNPADA
ncbi:hypothetical protein [Cryobacterium arcticum]|uniref:Uncharacterized protein n=1 Tax=Cryobacterium arcticum TaxID=670052 RepID=A0A318A5T3_9MICO|nr:hypothetical protein [Cryobacterium arcticum]PXA72721.1 hypothetical protein CTB96_01015 [Cryobacterium arcticum]